MELSTCHVTWSSSSLRMLSWFTSYCAARSPRVLRLASDSPVTLGLQVPREFSPTLPHRGCLVGGSTLFPFANAPMFPGPCSSSLLLPPGLFKSPEPLEPPSAGHISLVKCLLLRVPTERGSMVAPVTASIPAQASN